jgi:hypothetical protein
MATPLQDDIIAELTHGPACTYAIANRVMSRDSCVRRALNALQDRGLVRAMGWDSTGRRKRLMFELAPLRQAQRSQS